MSDSHDHVPGSTDEHQNRKDQSLIERAVTAVTGTPKGDRTEPGGPRGWDQPLEEQQAPGDGEPSRSSEQP